MIPSKSQHLTNAIAKLHLAHALLFVSEHKGTLLLRAKELAAMLLCKRSLGADLVYGGCKTCNACQRVWQSQHPNVHVLNSSEELADGDKRESEIKVDQIRELNAAHRLKGYEDGAQVFILENAHLLTKQAANALLKTLEEPYPDRYFVLLAPSLFSVMPTIASRCQRLFLAPPNDGELAIKNSENVEEMLSSLFEAPLAKRIQVALELSADRDILLERIALSIGQLDSLLHQPKRTAQTPQAAVIRQWLERTLGAEQKLRAHMNAQLCALEWLA